MKKEFIKTILFFLFLSLLSACQKKSGAKSRLVSAPSTLGATNTENTQDQSLPATSPALSITTYSDISILNSSSYSIGGECSYNQSDILLTIGTLSTQAVCESLSWSTTINVSALDDSNNITITADHSSAQDQSATEQVSINVRKDTSAPQLISNNIIAQTYSLAQTLSISIVFNESVIISGIPRLKLQLDAQSSADIYASYVSGSGSDTLVFEYTIRPGDADSNGIMLPTMIDLSTNTATIKDIIGNDAIVNLVSFDTSQVLVNSDVPSIVEFIEPVAATYAENASLLFQVNFNEVVHVTGVPRIAVDLAGTTIYANYKTGSGSLGLEFEYLIQAGDLDLDGISLLTNSIDLNGGTIRAGDNDNAVLDFSLFVDDLTSVIVNTATGITAPNQVLGLSTAPTTSNTELVLSWMKPNDNGTPIIDYAVQYREQGQSTWQTLSPAPNTNQASVSELLAGVTYEFRVAANNGLLGPFSAIQSAEIFDVLSLNPIAWLSATQISDGGMEPADGDKISSWSDLTGTATDATEDDVTKQPEYQVNVQNGLPAVYFDGTIDRGLEGSFTRVHNNGLTVFLVGRFHGTKRGAFFEFYDPSCSGGFSCARGFFFNLGMNRTTGSHVLDNTGFNVWSAYDNGNQTDMWENGLPIYTSYSNWERNASTAFTGPGSYVLGDDRTGNDRIHGWIAEFLIFDGPLTTSQMNSIEQYLKNKWGTP